MTAQEAMQYDCKNLMEDIYGLGLLLEIVMMLSILESYFKTFNHVKNCKTYCNTESRIQMLWMKNLGKMWTFL